MGSSSLAEKCRRVGFWLGVVLASWTLALPAGAVESAAQAPTNEASAASPGCPQGNVLRGARLVRWLDTTGPTALLVDGAVVPEGADWPSQAVGFASAAASLTFDLGAPTAIRSVYLQAGAADAFELGGSNDLKTWRTYPLPVVPGARGMRSRRAHLDGLTVRYVRFGGAAGPGQQATELAVFCDEPSTLPLRRLVRDPAPPPSLHAEGPIERVWLALNGTPWISPGQAAHFRFAIALTMLLALLARAGLNRRRSSVEPREEGAAARRRWDLLLGVLTLASVAGYYDAGAYHFPAYVHRHEFFHYYTGSKYFRELGYERLYSCAIVAEAEQGFRQRVEHRTVRDLTTNSIIGGDVALEAGRDTCKSHFTPERWAAFRRDVAFFRELGGAEEWEQILWDHGYNPSPAWTLVGAPLSNLGAASGSLIGSGESMFGGFLGLLDPVLLAGSAAALVWAFGWRAACVAIVFFGVSPLSTFEWTGGAFLRQDWFASAILGLCCVKRDRPLLGGVFVGHAALVRLFPAALLVPVCIKVLVVGWEKRRLDRVATRILAGALLAAAVIVPVSAVAAGGRDSWAAFARNTEKHASTPSSNLVGLRTLLSFRPSTRAEILFDPGRLDGFAPVRAARKANFRSAAPVYAVVVAAFLWALVRAAKRIDQEWILLILGAALILVLTELSSYYASIFAVTVLLVGKRDAPPIAPFVFIVLAQFADQWIAAQDTRFACISLLLVGLAGWVVWSRTLTTTVVEP